MTKAIKASETGLRPHYKVRIVLPGALIHVASWDLPRNAGYSAWEATWIEDPDYGDTIGYINWSKTIAVTWRYSP